MSKQNGDKVPDAHLTLEINNQFEGEEGDPRTLSWDSIMRGQGADIRLVAAGNERQPGQRDAEYGRLDNYGRPGTLVTPGGDTVQFGYPNNKSLLPSSYSRSKLVDGKSVAVERGKQDTKSGEWTIERLVDGKWVKQEDLSKSVTRVFGNVNTGVFSFVYKGEGGKTMVHEAHPRGQVVRRSEADTPFTAEREGRTFKMYPARTVITKDGVRSDYTYATEKDPAGKDVPVAQSRKLTDREGNVIEYAVKNKSGTIDIFRPKPGEKGLDPAKLNDPAKLAEYKIDFTGSKNPLDQVVSIDPDHTDGRRRTVLGNGDIVERRPSDGKIVRQHPGGRLTEYSLNGGKPELTGFESAISGEKFKFISEGGKLTKVEMIQPGSREKNVLVLKNNVWVDEATGKPPVGQDGKPEKISFERTADGIVQTRTDDKGVAAKREFHSDGSEVLSMRNKKGEVVPRIVISSTGVATDINSDENTMTTLFPRSNQPLTFRKNGDSYVEVNGYVAPEQGTPSLGADGNITWKRPGGKTEVWDRRTGPTFQRVSRPARRAA